MRIFIKYGTQAARWVRVVRKRKAPVVGEVFQIKQEIPGARAERVICREIRDVGGVTLYALELF